MLEKCYIKKNHSLYPASSSEKHNHFNAGKSTSGDLEGYCIPPKNVNEGHHQKYIYELGIYFVTSGGDIGRALIRREMKEILPLNRVSWAKRQGTEDSLTTHNNTAPLEMHNNTTVTTTTITTRGEKMGGPRQQQVFL